MKKVVIIDDEPLARSVVREYLAASGDYEIVAECGDGFEGVKAVMKYKPDLLFLDVQMPRINGFEMLEMLEEVPPVIFTTAFDEYAVKAFESNALDYLLKPFSRDRFNQALARSERQGGEQARRAASITQNPGAPEAADRIVVKNNTEVAIIPAGDILYLEAYDDYVKIFTRDTYYLKKKQLSYYETALDNSVFFRTHRSFIINLNALTKLEPMEKNSYVAVLVNGKSVPVSRSNYPLLRQKLGI